MNDGFLIWKTVIPLMGGGETLGVSLIYNWGVLVKVELVPPMIGFTNNSENTPHFVKNSIKLLEEILFTGRRFSLEELSSALTIDFTWMTDFDRNVYNILMSCPAGYVYTYSEVAKKAGAPNAARAVGNSMKKNRFPLFIPCHRVIKSDGKIGGYSAGVSLKETLLKHERWLAGKGC